MTEILRCFVDDETLNLLRMAADDTGRSIERLAEAAIENAAIEYKNQNRRRLPQANAEGE